MNARATRFRGKALKAHYVYAMCCISKRNTPTSLFLYLSACRTISLVQNLVRIPSALRFFSLFFSFAFLNFFAFSSLLPLLLCVCVCVCVRVLLPFVLSVLLAVPLSLLEFPFRLLALFSCFHLNSFASLLCLFLFCSAHYATKGIF